MRAALNLWWLLSLAWLTVLPAPAAPLRAPQRIINGQTVNLNPLFQWWTNHHGARPLTAWVHVTGPIVGTNSWGWIVEARVENTDRPNKPELDKGSKAGSPSKILVGNPPLWDQADFERLGAQLKVLNQEHASITSRETEARNRAQALTKEQKANPQNRVQAHALAQTARQWRQVETEAKAQLKIVDSQIKLLKTRLAAYPSPDHYVLDCFVLDTGQDQSQMPVYDHGRVAQ
jgi:hypothetical protein